MSNVAVELTRAAAAVAALGGSSAEFAGLSDAEVLAARGPIAQLLRLSNTVAALLAGTIAHRSRPEVGQSGLSARHGFGNPTMMVQDAIGLSRIEAGRLVAVGVLMGETETAERRAADAARAVERTAQAAEEAAAKAEREAAREAERAAAWAALHPDLPPLPVTVPRPVPPLAPAAPLVPVVVPWQAPIMHAVADGTFSPGVGDALLRGLGTLDQAITPEKLAAALRVLLVAAPGMNTEQAYKRARRMRDDLDAAGILAREKQARDDTTWSLWRRADGMVTLHALFPPEQGEMWMATYDALTSPRRGGVRFVDPERAAWAQSVKDDPRTLDQIAADSFTQLLKLGADADPNTLFGGRRPVVQIIVTEHDRPTTISEHAAPAAGLAPTAGPAARSGAPTTMAPAPVAPANTGATGAPSTERTERTDEAPSDTLAGNGTGRMTEARRGTETLLGTEPASTHPVSDTSRATLHRYPPRRSTGTCATPATSASSSAKPGNPSTLDETNASSTVSNAVLSRRATADAAGPAAKNPLLGQKPTTSQTGLIRDFPTLIMPFCSVVCITCCSITDTGRSGSATASTGCNPRSRSTLNSHSSPSPARTHSCRNRPNSTRRRCARPWLVP
ncbi:hypothetical protein [Cryobacterium sp. Hh7]|uniref:DUF222 domain-containing protein n=1 Tax=Cryobacterium sp. Hh7 TaxID=1259159 RepID=UPI001F542BFD|nr:hypothetical protein [Cryobacterium sp. Hh7]